MAEITGWFTMNGNHIPIMNGESKASAAKRFLNSKHGKDISKLKKSKKKLEDSLDSGLNDLNFDEMYQVYKNTKDAEIRGKLMDKMQEKDPYRFGKEVYGLDMKKIDYSGTFNEAVAYANKINEGKQYKTDTLYHGTDANFDKFSYENFGKSDSGDFGQGIYLTKNKQTANKYGKNVKEVDVKYKNPLILKNERDFENFYKKYGDEFGEAKNLYNSKQIAISIMKMGYDAVIDDVYGQVVIYNLKNTSIKGR